LKIRYKILQDDVADPDDDNDSEGREESEERMDVK
jgi:hypothetical protein